MSNSDSSHTSFECQSNSNSTQNSNVSDQTHIRHIDRGILPVRYDKATAESENIERCQVLTPLIQVLDVNQTQTQLKIANVSNQTHIRHIDRGILPVPYDKATCGSETSPPPARAEERNLTKVKVEEVLHWSLNQPRFEFLRV